MEGLLLMQKKTRMAECKKLSGKLFLSESLTQDIERDLDALNRANGFIIWPYLKEYEDSIGYTKGSIIYDSEEYKKFADWMKSEKDIELKEPKYSDFPDELTEDAHFDHYDSKVKEAGYTPEEIAKVIRIADQYESEATRGFFTYEQADKYADLMGLADMSGDELSRTWDLYYDVLSRESFDGGMDAYRKYSDAASAFAEIINREARRRRASKNNVKEAWSARGPKGKWENQTVEEIIYTEEDIPNVTLQLIDWYGDKFEGWESADIQDALYGLYHEKIKGVDCDIIFTMEEEDDEDEYDESFNEDLSDLDLFLSTPVDTKQFNNETFRALKNLVSEYKRDLDSLDQWASESEKEPFVKKWYKLADKCKEIAKNGIRGITGYGRLNDFIKLKIVDLARSVDNTFPWYTRNNLAKFNRLEGSLTEYDESIGEETTYYTIIAKNRGMWGGMTSTLKENGKILLFVNKEDRDAYLDRVNDNNRSRVNNFNSYFRGTEQHSNNWLEKHIDEVKVINNLADTDYLKESFSKTEVVDQLQKEIRDNEEQIRDLKHLIDTYSGENEDVQRYWQDKIDDLDREIALAEEEIERLTGKDYRVLSEEASGIKRGKKYPTSYLDEVVDDILDYFIECGYPEINPNEWLGCESWEEVKESIDFGALELYECAEGLRDILKEQIKIIDNLYDKMLGSRKGTIEQPDISKSDDPEYEIYSDSLRDLEREMKYYSGNLEEAAQKQTCKGEPRMKKLNKNMIQGLENYSIDEIKDFILSFIDEKLNETGTRIKILYIEPYGSRNRGTARDDSDLDFVFVYLGGIREDDLFNILNEDPFYIEDIRVDINPIRADKIGSLDAFMKKAKEYDKSILGEDIKTKGEQNEQKLTELRHIDKITTDRVYDFTELDPDIQSSLIKKLRIRKYGKRDAETTKEKMIFDALSREKDEFIEKVKDKTCLNPTTVRFVGNYAPALFANLCIKDIERLAHELGSDLELTSNYWLGDDITIIPEKDEVSQILISIISITLLV